MNAEIRKLEEDADKHASDIGDITDTHTEKLKQVQREHQDEVAELKSHVVQLEQEAKGLKQEAEKERQAAQQVKVGRQQGPEHKRDQVMEAKTQAVSVVSIQQS